MTDPDGAGPSHGYIDFWRHELQPGTGTGPVQQMSFVLLRCAAGAGTFLLPEGRSIACRPGDLICAAPGQVRELCAGPDGLVFQALHLADHSFAKDLFGDHDIRLLLAGLAARALDGRGRLALPAELRTESELAWTLLERHAQRTYPGRNAVVKAGAYLLCACLLRVPDIAAELTMELPHGAGVGPVATILQHIQEHYRERLTVLAMTRLARLSRSQFHASFRKATGSSFVEYVNRYRLMRAKHDLLRSDRPLADIALRHGFGSASRFSTVHRQHLGITPNEARRRWRRQHGQVDHLDTGEVVAR